MTGYLIVVLAGVAYLAGRCQQWWVDRWHYTGMAAARQDDLERKLRLARFLGRMESIQPPDDDAYRALREEDPTFRVWTALLAENNPTDERFREAAVCDRGFLAVSRAYGRHPRPEASI